ncbi:MAG TPA: MOSC domain-containing protein [Acidimicrobiia bacterium]|nr:MOSC domain-containing protein [Acidimicrobiia bacterium]
MSTGKLVGIYTTAVGGQPLVPNSEVEAIEGAGLAGDRYATGDGTYSGRTGPDRQVTFIEREAIAAVNESGVELGEHETRRNLVTEGVPLLDLIGETFRVGDVLFRGIKSCPPCAYLEEQTRLGVRKLLENRGGLRAEVVRGGMLRIGDEITVVPG